MINKRTVGIGCGVSEGLRYLICRENSMIRSDVKFTQG